MSDQSGPGPARWVRRLPVGVPGLAALAGLVVFVTAVTVFPHHSANHDEGVYLQQAALLLDGRLWMTSTVPEAVQPWFFVRDGARLYPKYSPVPAAVFAAGMAVGVPRLSLALVAAGVAGLVGLLTAAAFDRTTGAVSVLVLVATPLFLFPASTFLPYAPTLLFELAFALCYVRSVRTGSRRYAALAGGAIGTAFFARPYTAVLFAAPFVGHALASLVAARDHRPRFERALRRNATTAALGLAGVALTLAYNRAVTGDPLLFPYRAFAPLDGLGFGYRRILEYDRTYTPALAVRANAHLLWEFATRWTAAAPLGTVLAAVGVAGSARAWLRERSDGGTGGDDGAGGDGETGDDAHGKQNRDGVAGPAPGSAPGSDPLSDHALRGLLAALFVTVTAGNVYFWGNLNVLAAIDDPTDGLISLFGPFYHFDLLLPLSAFGAAGILAAVRGLGRTARGRFGRRRARVVVLAVLVVSLPLVGVAGAATLDPKLDRHADYTERYERAYEPFEGHAFDRALVFVPTPYGDWLNHPFQSLRNDPSLGGRVVYALDRDPAGDFAVLDAYPNRSLYRYTFRGEWTPEPRGRVTAALRPLERRRGERHLVTTTVGVPVGTETVSIRIESEGEAVQYGLEGPLGENLSVEWVVGPGNASVRGEGLRRFSEDRSVPVGNASEVVLAVTFTQYGGSTVTYRQAATVRATGDGVELLWPPATQVCRLTPACGHEGTYIRDAGGYPTGVSVETELETAGGRSG